MTTSRRISTDPDPFDDDEADIRLIHATKRRFRRSDLGLDREDDLVVDELEQLEPRPAGAEAPQEREATPASPNLPDPVIAEHARCACSWCSSDFQPRQGGKPQRFCSEVCRAAFHRGCRVWAVRAVDEGRLTVVEIREASPATYTFLQRRRSREG